MSNNSGLDPELVRKLLIEIGSIDPNDIEDITYSVRTPKEPIYVGEAIIGFQRSGPKEIQLRVVFKFEQDYK